MTAEYAPAAAQSPVGDFTAFYRAQLPVVFGYAMRLCGGDRHRAEDLTQEAFVALVDQLAAGRVERADIRWLLTVTRSRFVDAWRRDQRAQERLQLVWSRPEHDAGDEPNRSDVLDHVGTLDAWQRLVLVLRYVDELPVDEIAATIERTVDATYSLLARARRELRARMGGVA